MGGGVSASMELDSRVSEEEAKAWCGEAEFDPSIWARLRETDLLDDGLDDGCVPLKEFLAECNRVEVLEELPDVLDEEPAPTANHTFDVTKLNCTKDLDISTHIKLLRNTKYIHNLWRRINFKCHLNKAGQLKLMQVERLVTVCPVWKFPKLKGTDVCKVHYAFRNCCLTGRSMGPTFVQEDAFVESVEFPLLVRDIVCRMILNDGIVPDADIAADADALISVDDFAKVCAMVPGVGLDWALAEGKAYVVERAAKLRQEGMVDMSAEALEQAEMLRMMSESEAQGGKKGKKGEDSNIPEEPILMTVDAAFWSQVGEMVMPADVAMAGFLAAEEDYAAKKAAQRRKSAVKGEKKSSIRGPKYYKHLFKMYDVDNSGAIDAEEIMTMLRTMGQTPLQGRVDGLIKQFDLDDNGELDYEEFVKMMTHFYK